MLRQRISIQLSYSLYLMLMAAQNVEHVHRIDFGTSLRPVNENVGTPKV